MTTHTESNSEQPLKPCPFCPSGIGVVHETQRHIYPNGVETDCPLFAVICIDCGARGAEESTPQEAEKAWNARVSAPTVDHTPIDMILFCPRCGTQHVDSEESETDFRHLMEAWSLNAEPQDHVPTRWTNPPHKSHLCHQCGAVWRPADVPTNGVAQIKTRGERDNTWTNSVAVPAASAVAPVEQSAVIHWQLKAGVAETMCGVSVESEEGIQVTLLSDMATCKACDAAAWGYKCGRADERSTTAAAPLAATQGEAQQCSATCADFSMYLCGEAHRCVLDAGHPFDPFRGGGIHEFETHQTTVRPRKAIQ